MVYTLVLGTSTSNSVEVQVLSRALRMSKFYSSKKSFLDPILGLLLASNIFTIYLALSQGWSLMPIMCIYWFQSITIGFFNFVRMLTIKKFTTSGLTKHGMPVLPATEATRKFHAFFFLLHFGFFHLIYLWFIFIGFFVESKTSELNGVDFALILLAGVSFYINHLLSYLYNKPSETKEISLGILMYYPYARVVPMHLTIILGGIYYFEALPLFLILKTVVDVIMHFFERSIRGDGGKSLGSFLGRRIG